MNFPDTHKLPRQASQSISSVGTEERYRGRFHSGGVAGAERAIWRGPGAAGGAASLGGIVSGLRRNLTRCRSHEPVKNSPTSTSSASFRRKAEAAPN